MNHIKLTQEKPITVKMLATLLVGLAIFSSTTTTQLIVLLTLGILLFGYKISYKISKDFNNKKEFSIFGITLYGSRLEIEFPTYISIYSANQTKENNWGPISALGTSSNEDKVVIRLFSNNENHAVYKSKRYEKAKVIAKNLSDLLEIELIDQIKE